MAARPRAGDHPEPARPRILLAPVTVTPAKPLMPSHLKGLFWTDVMFRATGLLADVTYRCSHTVYDPCEQTVGFWEYLDRTLGDTDYSAYSEEEIGEFYVAFRRAAERVPFAACRPYVDAIEEHGWVHPASSRVLELWRRHYARLGLHDPGLTERQPPGATLEEMIGLLTALEMCLDLREHGGPVYLDATRYGLPLRQIVAADGRPNYMACALRELLPLAPGYDTVVLLYDRELEPDYLLLQRVLSRLGPYVHRVGLGRVPIDGSISTARQGHWRGNTAGSLLAAASHGYDDDTIRLGMRLYFIAMLGPGDRESFRRDLLHRCLNRARRMLAAGAGPGSGPVDGGMAGYLERHRGDNGCVDPYRLTSGLLSPHVKGPVRDVLSAVFT